MLNAGINKVRNFIHSENYTIDSVIINAAKAAYLSKLIEMGVNDVHHFDNDNDNATALSDAVISVPLPTKLNKFKKSNIEAFFYWNEVQNLMEHAEKR